MKNLKFKTRAGIEVELDDVDMYNVHKYYEAQLTAEYLKENHEDWSENKVEVIAWETRRLMFEYDYDEDEAISYAIDWYEETYEAAEEVMESEDE